MPDRIVHIVDDDEAVRQSLAFLLGSAGLTVRLYDSASAFLAGLSAVKSGCLVTDMRMPDMTGIELLQQLRAKACRLPAIVITGHGDVPLAVEAMKAGAVDFIEKPFDQETILHAVQAALERSFEGEGREDPAVAARVATLSERERQVLEGLVAGHPNKTIAYDLGISPRTVEVYRANLMTKMGARSLSELIRMAIIAKVAPTGRAAK
jgi:two-component system, LuxR family, response regulator FixJ